MNKGFEILAFILLIQQIKCDPIMLRQDTEINTPRPIIKTIVTIIPLQIMRVVISHLETLNNLIMNFYAQRKEFFEKSIEDIKHKNSTEPIFIYTSLNWLNENSIKIYVSQMSRIMDFANNVYNWLLNY